MDKKIRVLMVDDEERFRETTNKILTRRGFETIMAENGESALRNLEQNPDVVILDIRMRGMDGHETLREIKKRKPDIPVIMLTGHGDIDSAKRAKEQGAYDYLAKPCDIDVLTGKIRDAAKGKIPKAEHKENDIFSVMIPIDDYTTLKRDATVRQLISELKKSFSANVPTSRIMETGHRSVLVVDDRQNVIGIVAITDLLQMIMPAYLSVPKPSTAQSIQYSPIFWRGMFLQEVRRKADVKIEEIMSPAPYTISSQASLMEATYVMMSYNVRRLVVEEHGRALGIIREQDLFFEMETILRNP